MRVTQKDIARQLNISQSLVARVLNNQSNVWISEAKRQHILEVARDLNYRPHGVARALRSGKTQVVACIFLGSAGYHAIVETLAEAMSNLGYSLLVHVILDLDKKTERIERLLSEGLFDAVILWGLEQDTEEVAAQLAHQQVPFVVKGRFEEQHPEWLQVNFDHERMMYQAVAHLSAQGHRRIAYLGYDNGQVYTRKLIAGYQQGIQTLLSNTFSQEYIQSIGSEPLETATRFASWMARPEAERPTALVMGVGRHAWEEIELWLAARNERIGEQAGAFGLCGMRGDEVPLLFGEAYVYAQTNLADLARAMAEQAVLPLLRGDEPASQTIQYLPELVSHPSLRLPLPLSTQPDNRAELPDTAKNYPAPGARA